MSMFISILCYLLNNCPYPYWDSLDKFCWLEYIISNTIPEKLDRSDAFFINVSYDKQIANYTYSNGLHGNIAITNRETLLNFLKIAEETNTYKYIFLDVRFEEGIETDADSALFAQIKSMRDISYSTHSDIVELRMDSAVRAKAAINDYFTTIISTNFTRYQFLQDGKESAPLRIYTETDSTNKPIKQCGLIYYSDGKLCQNSPFMRIPENFYAGHDGIKGHQNYYDLGPMLLTMWSDVEEWRDEMKDKIVIVGDFVNDLHDTYIGMQPGSYLIYLTYKALCDGKHFVSWLFIILMFICYIIIILFVLNRETICHYIPNIKGINSKFILFILDMVGYSASLSFLAIVFYVYFKMTYNIFIPSTILSILSLFVSYKNSKNQVRK